MIAVRIEIWPKGDPRGKREIELVTITNVEEGDPSTYCVIHEGHLEQATVRHSPADGALALVTKALAALTSKR